jgi:hypothetical protein
MEFEEEKESSPKSNFERRMSEVRPKVSKFEETSSLPIKRRASLMPHRSV